MSFSVIVRDIYQNIILYFDSLKEKNNYIIPTIVGGCVVLAIAGLCFFYYSHIRNKEYTAQVVLSECMGEYMKAREGQADWTTVELMCKAGYEKFAATKTAVYFIPFRVDALLALDQREAVMQLLKQMLERLGISSPLYSLYKTKLALIKLDDASEEMKNEGLKELQELGENTANLNRDVALYYLVQYYSLNGQSDAANAALAQLETLQPKESKSLANQSPWLASAQEMFGAA